MAWWWRIRHEKCRNASRFRRLVGLSKVWRCVFRPPPSDLVFLDRALLLPFSSTMLCSQSLLLQDPRMKSKFEVFGE